MTAAPLNGAHAAPASRRRGRRADPPGEPSHADLLRKATADAEDAKSRTDALHLVVQRVEGKLDRQNNLMEQLVRAIGAEDEDEHGLKVGTGLTGRLMRLELSVRRRFHMYDRWTWLASGALAAAGVAAAIIWWLVENRVGFLR